MLLFPFLFCINANARFLSQPNNNDNQTYPSIVQGQLSAFVTWFVPGGAIGARGKRSRARPSKSPNAIKGPLSQSGYLGCSNTRFSCRVRWDQTQTLPWCRQWPPTRPSARSGPQRRRQRCRGTRSSRRRPRTCRTSLQQMTLWDIVNVYCNTGRLFFFNVTWIRLHRASNGQQRYQGKPAKPLLFLLQSNPNTMTMQFPQSAQHKWWLCCQECWLQTPIQK